MKYRQKLLDFLKLHCLYKSRTCRQKIVISRLLMPNWIAFRPQKVLKVFLKDHFQNTLLIIIVPYSPSIGKCFGVFFPYALEYKIYCLKLSLYILKQMPRHIGTCFRFYTKMLYIRHLL